MHATPPGLALRLSSLFELDSLGARGRARGMEVQVSGRRIDVGDALQTRITGELNAALGRYFERGGIKAEVMVGRDAHEFTVECVVRLASGQLLESQGAGLDAHAAFAAALDKFEKRVRRYKRKLKNHHRPSPRSSGESTPA